MPKDPKEIPAFTAPGGRTLFIIEKGVVYVFGEGGGEAAVPVADLAAFLEHCGEEVSPDPKQTTAPGRPEE